MGTYKDSGIEWIGEIPEGWEIIKIKHAFKLFAGGDIDYNDYSEEQDGFYQYPILANSLENSGIIGFTSKYRFSGETITITGRGSVGVAFHRNFPYFPVVRLLVGVPTRNLSTKYVTYSINSFDTIGEQTAMTQLTTDKLGVEKIPLPPLREQTAIADFLDKKNAKIDAITEKITQQIQTLKDYRQSLITETVTKGLDKTAAYKDSGIEWIGEIPNDWDVNKIKYTSTLHGRIGWQGLTSEEYIDEGPYLITGTDFQNGEIDWDSCVHISEERWAQADKIQIKDGDLLITKDGTVGKTAIVTNLNDKASLNSGVLLINLQTHSKKYLYWLLNSKVFWEWFDITNSGNSTILHLYQRDFDNFSFPIPPLQEQAAIADFLDDKTAKIDRIIAKKEQQLDIIKEHRKSLIYEYVTGKKRVKEYQQDGN